MSQDQGKSVSNPKFAYVPTVYVEQFSGEEWYRMVAAVKRTRMRGIHNFRVLQDALSAAAWPVRPPNQLVHEDAVLAVIQAALYRPEAA